jgi:hypothetical protein
MCSHLAQASQKTLGAELQTPPRLEDYTRSHQYAAD